MRCWRNIANYAQTLLNERNGLVTTADKEKVETQSPSIELGLMPLRSLSLLVLLACLDLPAWAGHTLTPHEQKIVQSWLMQHPAYRTASDADCNCAEQIRQMKAGSGGQWKPVADYHPYVATGDFNGDRVPDFAVEVIDTSKSPQNFVLLVFNGPFRSESASPAFVESGVGGQALFFGPPRPKPYRLVIGPFESNNSAILLPRGTTYRLDSSSED